MKRVVKTLGSRGARLFFAAVLIATIAPQLLTAKPSSASDGDGYPWSNATTLDQSQYDWGYHPCPSSDTTCADHSGMNYNLNGTTYGMADPWVYSLRNCTSYVAWKINAVFGVNNISGWGSAYQWNTGYTSSQPYTVENPATYTPQAGDIAQWGSEVGGGYGHVAYVYGINGSGYAELDEYNVAGTGAFTSSRTTQTGSGQNYAGVPDNYIHIGTVSSGGGNELYQFTDTSGSWTQTDITDSPGGVKYGMSGTPSVLWGTPIQVFGVGPGGILEDYEPNGSTWYPYTIASSPVLSTTAGVYALQVGSSTEVFAVGTNGHLYQFVNSGSGWGAGIDITYQNNQGTFWTVEGSPSVIWGNPIHIFVAHTNGELLDYQLPSGGQWFPYTLTSPSTVTGDTASTLVGSTYEIFTNGPSNRLLQFAGSGTSYTKSDVTYGTYTVKGGPSLLWGNPSNVYTIGANTSNGQLLNYQLAQGSGWWPSVASYSLSLSGGTTAVPVGSTIQVFGD